MSEEVIVRTSNNNNSSSEDESASKIKSKSLRISENLDEKRRRRGSGVELHQDEFKIPLNSLYLKDVHETLPSNVAIPIGLAQLFMGVAMVVCGSLALRYRSYLFYYGTGLWAGTISGISGALVVMGTKKGMNRPKWVCGGTKWQIHFVIGATMLAISSSVLLAMFSTSGLMQDTMHSVGVELGSPTRDEETFERRKSTGVAINAILLLLSMLEILLCFSSFGICLRVLCRSPSSSIFSTESGSQVSMRDIIGTGPEYEARKDRLLRWLGHQRRNFFSSNNGSKVAGTLQKKNYSAPSVVPSIAGTKRPHTVLVPHFIAGQPQMLNAQKINAQLLSTLKAPSSHVRNQTQILIPHPHPYPAPQHQHSNFCAHPGHMTHHPPPFGYPMVFYPQASAEAVEAKRRRRGEERSLNGSSNSKSSRSTLSDKNRKRGGRRRNGTSSSANKGVKKEISEEEIGKTYTGLDRALAEDFISNSMDKY